VATTTSILPATEIVNIRPRGEFALPARHASTQPAPYRALKHCNKSSTEQIILILKYHRRSCERRRTVRMTGVRARLHAYFFDSIGACFLTYSTVMVIMGVLPLPPSS
jgi:hypothetical protein